jgi:hypothetical protein
MKNRQPQNVRGLNQRPLIKKEATPKGKGLKPKTSDEKKRQQQHVGGLNQTPPMKKRQPQNARCLSKRLLIQIKNQGTASSPREVLII